MPLPVGPYLKSAVTNPSASVTDFTLLVRIDSTNTDYWTENDTTDATKARFAKDIGEVELAFDPIFFDQVGQLAIFRVLWSGSLSDIGVQELRAYPPKAANPSYGVNDTFGQYAAYDANWDVYHPFVDDFSDRLVGGNDSFIVSGTPAIIADPEYGGVVSLPGATKNVLGTNHANPGATLVTQFGFGETALTGSISSTLVCDPDAPPELVLREIGGEADFVLNSFSSDDRVQSGTVPANTYIAMTGRYDGSELSVWDPQNGKASVTPGGSWPGLTPVDWYGTLEAAGGNEPQTRWDGTVSHISTHIVGRSDAWIETERAQVVDNGTFWGPWSWITPGGDVVFSGTIPTQLPTIDNTYTWDAGTSAWQNATSYALNQVSGQPLPSWLQFNTSTGIIEQIAPAEQIDGDYSEVFSITGSGAGNPDTSNNFAVSFYIPTAYPPTDVQNQTAPAGSQVVFTANLVFPAADENEQWNIFVLNPTGQALNVELSINGGSTWLPTGSPPDATLVKVGNEFDPAIQIRFDAPATPGDTTPSGGIALLIAPIWDTSYSTVGQYTITALADISVTVDDGLGLNDSIVSTLDLGAIVSDQLGLDDLTQANRDVAVFVTDELGLSDLTNSGNLFDLTISDGVGLNDSSVIDVAINLTVNEYLGLDDQPIGNVEAGLAIIDALGLNDSASVSVDGDVFDSGRLIKIAFSDRLIIIKG